MLTHTCYNRPRLLQFLRMVSAQYAEIASCGSAFMGAYLGDYGICTCKVQWYPSIQCTCMSTCGYNCERHTRFTFCKYCLLLRPQNVATAALFLAAKVEEQPRKLEHLAKVFHSLHSRERSELDTGSPVSNECTCTKMSYSWNVRGRKVYFLALVGSWCMYFNFVASVGIQE